MAIERADLGYVETLIKLAIQHRVERLRVGEVEVLTSPLPYSEATAEFDRVPAAAKEICNCGHERPEHNDDGLCLLCDGKDCSPPPEEPYD